MPQLPTISFPLCQLCHEHVSLESCNTDENGQAVHEKCYTAKIMKPRRVLESCREWLFLTVYKTAHSFKPRRDILKARAIRNAVHGVMLENQHPSPQESRP
jgi:hypothetical protein